MKINLKSTGSTSNFVQWLKSFKDIDPSIIIEVDVANAMFVAKGFPQDKSIVKYSKITFEEAGYELGSIVDDSGVDFNWENYDVTTDGRIKIGIYELFSKVIEVITMFSETDHEMVIEFGIDKKVKYMNVQSNVTEYTAIVLTMLSKSLKMNIKCSQLTDFFQKLDDNTFLNIACNISSPSVYEVNIGQLANLAKISSVLSIDKSKDKIKFYSKEVDGHRAFYAQDATAMTYDYLIGYHCEGEDGNTVTIVSKENFLNATKGLNTETLKITLDTAGASRIIIDSDNAKIVVGAIKG